MSGEALRRWPMAPDHLCVVLDEPQCVACGGTHEHWNEYCKHVQQQSVQQLLVQPLIVTLLC